MLSCGSRLRCSRNAALVPFARHYVAKASAHYDLVVIGSGPAAQKCALQSAKQGKSVVVVDKSSMHGGVCVHTGTIPSKTFREAVLHLTGWRHQGFYGKVTRNTQASMSVPDLLMRVKKVENSETEVVRDKLQREGVELISGTARFVSGPPGEPHRVMVLRTGIEAEAEAKTSVYRHIEASLPTVTLSGDRYLIACGTRPLRRPGVPFDGVRVFDSDQLLWGGVRTIPRDLIVVGSGVIGMEYASMMNIIPGTTVSIIDPREEVLGFADREVVQALCYTMRKNGARFLMGEKLKSVEVTAKGKVLARLLSGKRVMGDALLYTMGRLGNTDSLNLEAIGVEPDERGLLQVNDFYQTSRPDVYACGDVIGYPALASTSMEQGLRAAHHMWADMNSVYTSMENSAEALSVSVKAGMSVDASSNSSDTDAGTQSDSDSDKEEGAVDLSTREGTALIDEEEEEDGEENNLEGESATLTSVAPTSVSGAEDSRSSTLVTSTEEGEESNPAPFPTAPPLPPPVEIKKKKKPFPFGIPDAPVGRSSENLFPYGIYTIPAISMIGKTEASLTREGVSYEVGVAHYRELAKGQMLGGVDGFLKLIFDVNTLKLLGVHAFGEGATEIIHIGQVVMSQGGTIKYFHTAVFNYPTLAEAYNVAARDGLRKVGTI